MYLESWRNQHPALPCPFSGQAGCIPPTIFARSMKILVWLAKPDKDTILARSPTIISSSRGGFACQTSLRHDSRDDFFPSNRHQVNAVHALFALLLPRSAPERSARLLLPPHRRPFHPLHELVWDKHTGDFIIHVLGHFIALQRGDADQDVHLVQDIPLGKLVQPFVQPIGVIDQVGLEELRAGIDLLVLANRLEARLGCERRGSSTRGNIWGGISSSDHPGIFHHPASGAGSRASGPSRYRQYPFCPRVQAPFSCCLLKGRGCCARPARSRPSTSACRPTLVRSRAAICITGSAPFWTAMVLHAQLDMRGVAEGQSVKLIAADIGFDQINVLDQFLCGSCHRRRHFAGDNKLSGLQTPLQLGNRFVVGRSMIFRSLLATIQAGAQVGKPNPTSTFGFLALLKASHR